MLRHTLIILTLLLSSCVYTLNIQQGNILDQKDIDKLRAGLTKNQVIFVLGNPVVDDSFSDQRWIYLYTYSDRRNDTETTKRLELSFVDDKLVKATGDFKMPEGLGEPKPVEPGDGAAKDNMEAIPAAESKEKQ